MAGPSQDDLSLIKSLEAITQETIDKIKDASRSGHLDIKAIERRILALRDEAAKAKEADLPAIFDQLNSEKALYLKAKPAALPNLLAPFFAHMQLEEEGKKKDILIGHQTFLDGNVPIIDWRHAPIAKIFFKYRQGDEFEEKLPGRLSKGVINQRNIVTFKEGQLNGIILPEAAYTLENGEWQEDRNSGMPKLQGGQGAATRGKLGTGQSGKMSAEVSALLDPKQYELLSKGADEPLLVLGTAGSGKTTVALHRVGHLTYEDPLTYPQNKIVVIVPDHGLAHLSRQILSGLGLSKVQCLTYERWVSNHAHMLIRKLPKKICDETPTRVVRLKRHPAMAHAIDLLITHQRDALVEKIRSKFSNTEPVIAKWESLKDLTLMDALDKLTSFHKSKVEGASRKNVVQKFYKTVKTSFMDIAKDRTDLFLNPQYLKTVVDHSAGELSDEDGRVTLSHTVAQSALSPFEDIEDVDDESRLMAIDGHDLREDQKNDPVYKTIDIEDLTILIYLMKRKMGDSFNFRSSAHHMVIDEAQDFAPLELEVLALGRRDPHSVTIAGDEAQTVDGSSYFKDWPTTLSHLGAPQVDASKLLTTYRSTMPITKFAHQVLGKWAPPSLPVARKEGVPVSRTTYPNDGQAMLVISDTLANLMVEEPGAYVGVITRTFEGAQKIYNALEDIPKVKLVENGDFRFSTGIDIADAAQVKGLEFDYVIIPDATLGVYPDNPLARRQLHVAATRAIHQLWVVSIGREAKILPERPDDLKDD